jgi:tetratricopeptide (TPR) repeat protein
MAACSACTPPCERDRVAQDWPAAFTSCSTELQRTGSIGAGIVAARAAFYLQRYDDAERLATPLVTTARAPDAHSLLGQIALQRGDFQAALQHLLPAAYGHMFTGDSYAYSRDAYQLAGVWFELGSYEAALAAEQTARTVASYVNDDRMKFYVDVAHADILRALGDSLAAELALDRAVSEAAGDDDRILGLLKQGLLYLEIGHMELGRARLHEALHAELARPRPRQVIVEPAWLNLAYLDRLANHLQLALDEIEAARRAGTDEMTYRLNRGLVLADLGQSAQAADDLAAAEAEHPTGRWAWWVPFQRGVLAARAGDIAGAIAADRRAIAKIGELARLSGSRGATLVASHRGPYEHLIGLLAAGRAWRDVLDVIAAMDVADVLDARDDHRAFLPTSVDRPAPRTVRVAPGQTDAQTILAAWQHQRLVIMVPDGTRLWRLDVHDGMLDGAQVGDAHHLGELAARLESDPGDHTAAAELSAAIVPADLRAGEPLAVLSVGPIARAPLAALRMNDQPLIERSPVLRATAIVPRVPLVTFDATRALVIGDPSDNLPAARDEAIWVARQFGAAVYVGGAATRSALAAAHGAHLLHVSAHSETSVLPLHDGDVSAYDALVPARIVVLASCGAAAGTDDAGHGSLARAFLDAGAEVVIATPWSVGDEDARRVVKAFYGNGGATTTQAGRALARAQLELASTMPIRSWVGFEVLIGRPRRVEI